MSEFITRDLQVCAVVLAEELSLSSGANRLGMSIRSLNAQIDELAARLECHLFRVEDDHIEITEDGRVLIDAFRVILARREKSND